MTVPFVVPFYAAIFALIYVVLSIRVAQMRGVNATMIGDGGNARLERTIRVHGNFAEYVPFALLLLGWCEMQHNSIYILHVLGIVLLLGRLLHAYGVAQVDEKMVWRATGIGLTWLVLIVAALMLIYDFFRILPTT